MRQNDEPSGGVTRWEATASSQKQPKGRLGKLEPLSDLATILELEFEVTLPAQGPRGPKVLKGALDRTRGQAALVMLADTIQALEGHPAAMRISSSPEDPRPTVYLRLCVIDPPQGQLDVRGPIDRVEAYRRASEQLRSHLTAGGLGPDATQSDADHSVPDLTLADL